MNPNDFQGFEALIFDMDGTLVDSGPLHENAWSEALEHFGIPVDRALMRSLCGVPTFKTVEMLINKFSISNAPNPADVTRRKEHNIDRFLLDYVKPTPLEALVHHFEGSKPMAVGTGATTAEAERVLSHCGLNTQMSAIIGADQVSRSKPAPDTFLLCAEKLGVSAENCVVFEDAALGLEAGRAAGMEVIDVASAFAIHNDYFC